MRRRATALLLAGLLAGCNLSRVSEDRQKASDIFTRKGIQFMEDGQYEAALHDLRHAIDINGRNSEAYNALAVLYERLNRPDDARDSYQKAMGLDAENYGAKNNYSRFLCQQGQYDEGVALLEQIVATKLYDQAWISLTNQGICHQAAGRPEQAEQSFRAALEDNPRFAPALWELARLSFDNKNYLKARAFLQRFAESSGHSAQTLWLATKTEQALGNEPGFKTYLQRLRTEFPDSAEAKESKKAFP